MAITSTPLPTKTGMMTAHEATWTLNQISNNMREARRLIYELYIREGWRALKYPSWRRCIQDEFTDVGQRHLYNELKAAQIEVEIYLAMPPEDVQLWKYANELAADNAAKAMSSAAKTTSKKDKKSNSSRMGGVATTFEQLFKKEDKTLESIGQIPESHLRPLGKLLPEYRALVYNEVIKAPHLFERGQKSTGIEPMAKHFKRAVDIVYGKTADAARQALKEHVEKETAWRERQSKKSAERRQKEFMGMQYREDMIAAAKKLRRAIEILEGRKEAAIVARLEAVVAEVERKGSVERN